MIRLKIRQLSTKVQIQAILKVPMDHHTRINNEENQLMISKNKSGFQTKTKENDRENNGTTKILTCNNNNKHQHK